MTTPLDIRPTDRNRLPPGQVQTRKWPVLHYGMVPRIDLSRWTFLTGDRDDVDQFAARFGVSVGRALNDARDITHNLRTAIIGADGKLVKVYTGNDWSPEQVLADLKKLD